MREYLFNYDAGAARAVPESTLEALTKQRHPDAALVYLYLLKNGGKIEPGQAETDLAMDSDRLEMALAVLQRIRALRGGTENLTEAIPTLERPFKATEYTVQEVERAQKEDQQFRWLVARAEKYLGGFPNFGDRQRLLYVRQHINLPMDILAQLLNHMGEKALKDNKSFYLSTFVTAAKKWEELRIDTDEKVQAQIEREDVFWVVWRKLGFADRDPVGPERNMLQSWLNRSYAPELIYAACDETVYKIGRLKWDYANSILERWEGCGYKTVADKERGEARSGSPASQSAGAVQSKPQEPVSPEVEAAYREHMRKLYEAYKSGNDDLE